MIERALGADELYMLRLPPGERHGLIVAVQLSCGLDESGAPNDPNLCAAAYVFAPRGLWAFNKLWWLTLKFYGLPFSHMTDCMTLNPRVRKRPNHYLGWSSGKRIRLTKCLIAIIRSTARFGVSVSVNRAAYAETIKKFEKKPNWKRMLGDVYAFTAIATCEQCVAIKNKDEHLSASDVVFFVEKRGGDSDEVELRALFNVIDRDPDLKKFFSHYDFHPNLKGGTLAIEAADMLAWFWRRKGINRLVDTDDMPYEGLAKRLMLPRRIGFGIKHYHYDVQDEGDMAMRLLRIAMSPWFKRFFPGS